MHIGMADLKQVQQTKGDAALATELKQRVGAVIDLMVSGGDSLQQDFADLLDRADVLWQRKQMMLGVKSETRARSRSRSATRRRRGSVRGSSSSPSGS